VKGRKEPDFITKAANHLLVLGKGGALAAKAWALDHHVKDATNTDAPRPLSSNQCKDFYTVYDMGPGEVALWSRDSHLS
jgi:hypothetical protein